jgi:hypothetical protein
MRGLRSSAAGALLALTLLLAGCASGGTGSAKTATPTMPAEPTATLANPTGAGTPTPTAAGVAGSGSLDICQPVTPTPIQISVPPEIPVYQGAQIKLAEANGPTSEFGYCITGSVSAVASFYTQALPGKGWGNIENFVNLNTENIIASRQSPDQSLTITVSPDTLQPGNVDLLIILQTQ